MFRIELAKESFKFSCTHFTIFGPTSAERMHGHNYKVSFAFSFDKIDANLGLGFDFNQLKPQLKALCDQLDEAILLPEKSPFLDIRLQQSPKLECEVLFAHKRYVLPTEDVRLLPIANVTVEELSRLLHMQACHLLKDGWEIFEVDVRVEETSGQRVSFAAAPSVWKKPF